MTDEEVIKLMFVADTAQVKSATGAVGALEAESRDLEDAWKRGAVTAANYQAASARIAAGMKVARHEAAETAQTVDYLNKTIAQTSSYSAATSGLKQVAGGASNASYKLMLMGQFIDDLQYVPQMGLRPVIGQVMQFSAGLGIALIAANTLFTNWKSISSLWGEGHTETEAEKMERLAKATNLTAHETSELNRLKKEQKAIEASAGPSKAQAQSASDIASVVKEAAEGDRTGQDVLAQQIATARAKRNGDDGFLNPEDKQKLHDIRQEELRPDLSMVAQGKATAQGKTLEEYFAEKRRQVQADAEKREVEQAKADIAPTNKAGREQTAATLRGIGREDLAKQVEAADPDAIKKKQQEAEFSKAEAARLAEQRKRDEDEAAGHNAENEKKRQARAKILADQADQAAKGMQDKTEARFLSNQAKSENDPNKQTASKFRAEETARIQNNLEGLYGKDVAQKIAPAVFDKIHKDILDKVREKSLSGGMSPDQAVVAMQAERQTKAMRERLAAQQKAAAEARGKLPGIDQEVESQLQRGMFAGGKAADVGKKVGDRLKSVLMQRGMSDADATAASRQMVSEGGQRLGDRMRAMQGGFLPGPMLVPKRQAAMMRQMQARAKRQQAINNRKFAGTRAAMLRRAKSGMVEIRPKAVPEAKEFASKIDGQRQSMDSLSKILAEVVAVSRETLNRGVPVKLR